MLSFFKRKISQNPLHVDIHSHLLPNLDDGVSDFDEAIQVISQLHDLGYQKLITTPHIMSDSYRNTPEIIQAKWTELNAVLSQNNIPVKIEIAAEYYLDTWLINHVNEGKSLMTFGPNYFLFEMNYTTEPYQLNDFIFKLITLGYKPVLAHPERYWFMNMEKAEELSARGVYLQVNVMSFTDYYTRPVKKLAHQLVDNKCIHFLGTDCHGKKHLQPIDDALKTNHFKKALDLPLLNYQL